MKNTKTDRRAQLLKKFHTVCSVNGIRKEDKEVMVASYGVESSRDLNEFQLIQLIEALEKEPDMWRKRVLASVGAWLRQINKQDNADIIKAIACRATKTSNFNSIPVSRLRDLYYEFSKKAKTVQSVQMIKADEIAYLQSAN